jgi:hypothetical protein
MKKFLIVLMAVAMVTFLFGGCFPVKNQPPIITSDPVKTGEVGVEYTYDVNATDSDIEDVLTYYLTAYPNGMNINSATGLIKWTPAIEGDYAVIVKVSDGELDITQSFTIVVSEPEPVPDPELVLVGIVVDPKTMELFVGDTEDIDSVTACYDFRSYGVILDFDDCLFLTSNSEVATVKKITDNTTVTVTAEGVGTADILVSYKGEVATLKVTVTALTSMELIVDMPKFVVGEPTLFTIEVVANSDVGKENVMPYFTLPPGYARIGDLPPDYTIEWFYEDEWVDLTIFPFPIFEPATGEVELGTPGKGDLLIDEVLFFRGIFNKVGTYITVVEFWTVIPNTPPLLQTIKVDPLCFKVITLVVEPPEK